MGDPTQQSWWSQQSYPRAAGPSGPTADHWCWSKPSPHQPTTTWRESQRSAGTTLCGLTQRHTAPRPSRQGCLGLQAQHAPSLGQANPTAQHEHPPPRPVCHVDPPARPQHFSWGAGLAALVPSPQKAMGSVTSPERGGNALRHARPCASTRTNTGHRHGHKPALLRSRDSSSAVVC